MNRLFLKAVLALAALSLTACGGGSASSWLQGVNVATTNNGDLQVSMTAAVNTNQLSLTPVDLQFFHPNNPSQVWASINITQPSSTVTDITLSYDFTQSLSFANLSTATTLPNGTPIPVTGPNPSWFVIQPTASPNSNIYLNFNVATKQAAIGYVLNYDKLGSGVVGDLLLNFAMTGVVGQGAGGIYSGAQTGQSGFCFFADISALFGSAPAALATAADVTPDSAKVKIETNLYNLNNNQEVLQLN